MAWLAVDGDRTEVIFDEKPRRFLGQWRAPQYFGGESTHWIVLQKGSIRKLIGRELTWEDEPVEFKNEE